jgi:hypothetical protein
MSKRLVIKLILTVATLCVITLLQGCSAEVDSAVLSKAWMPVGSAPSTTQDTTGGTTTGGGGGSNQGVAVQ